MSVTIFSSPYVTLLFAVFFEVMATMLLPVSKNFTKPLPTALLLVGYAMAFYCLALVSQRLPLGIIYATWSGLGVFFVSLLSYIFFQQVLNITVIVGMVFIVVGVSLVNLTL